VGMCQPVLQIHTLFQTKKISFFTPFFRPAWPLKSIPILRPGLEEIISTALRLEQQQKRFLKIHFKFAYFSFSNSFGIETINAFVHSQSSLEKHTRFQTKMSKVYTHFQTKALQKPYPLGCTYLYGLYKGVPPSPPRLFNNLLDG